MSRQASAKMSNQLYLLYVKSLFYFFQTLNLTEFVKFLFLSKSNCSISDTETSFPGKIQLFTYPSSSSAENVSLSSNHQLLLG